MSSRERSRWPSVRAADRSADKAADVAAPRASHGEARGFVMLVALGLVVVLSVALMLQLGATQQVDIASLRLSEDAAARSIAEGCLAHATALVTHVPPPDPDDPGVPPDLSPLFNNTLGGDVVRFPPGGPKWGFFRRGQGACFIRIEDNSDDVDGVDAGVGQDFGNVDTDLAVVVSAIGLYPVLATTPSAEAFGRAHTHVTLRRLLSLRNRGIAGISAGRDIVMSESARLCGAGGMNARRLDLSDSACACGLVNVAALGGTLPEAGCACVDDRNDDRATASSDFVACADTVRDSVPEPLEFFDTQPASTSILDPGRLGSVSPTKTMPPDESCPFFVGVDDTVYLWDSLDQTPKTPSDPLATVTCAAGSRCATESGRCDDYRVSPVERPCTWAFTATTASATCNAGESPCWKPVASLSATPSLLSTVVARWDTNRGNTGEPAIATVTSSEGPSLAFRKNRRFFLSASTRGVFGSATGQCGANLKPAGVLPCDSCDGGDAVFARSASGFVVRRDANLARMPAPSMFIVDGDRDIVVDGAARGVIARSALPISLITNGAITVKARASISRTRLAIDPTADNFDEIEARMPVDPDPSASRDNCERAIQVADDFPSAASAPLLSSPRCTLEDVGLIGGRMDCDVFVYRGSCGCLAPTEILSTRPGGSIVIAPTAPAYLTGLPFIESRGDVRIAGFARLTEVVEIAGANVVVADEAVVRGFGGLIIAKNRVSLIDRALVVSDEALETQERGSTTTEVPW